MGQRVPNDGGVIDAIAAATVVDLVLTGVAEHGGSHSHNCTFEFLSFLVEHVRRCRGGDLVFREEDDERDPRSCEVAGKRDGGSSRGCGRCGVVEKKRTERKKKKIFFFNLIQYRQTIIISKNHHI